MIGRRPLGHWLLLIALATMWGSSFLFTKIAVASLTPTAVVAARLVIAALVLGALILILGNFIIIWPHSSRVAENRGE